MVGEPDISAQITNELQRKMSLYNGEISRMPEWTLSLIMRKQSHKSKLRNILLRIDFLKTLIFSKNQKEQGLGWCGSVDCVLACEPNDRQFDSQSGRMPGMRAWWRGTPHVGVSLPAFLLPFPSL